MKYAVLLKNERKFTASANSAFYVVTLTEVQNA